MNKNQLIEKYGLEQTISYYYYLWNAISYVGRKWVKDSFESVKHLDVIIGDYNSNDGTKELAEEYGFKVITVPKTKGKVFHESKIENAIIHNIKANFLVDLSVHYNYPKNMDDFCRNYLSKNINNIKNKILILRGKYNDGLRNGSWMSYKPYWLEVRGFDERCSYPFVGQYGTNILLNFWKLKYEEHYIGMVHKPHFKIRANWRKQYIKPIHEERILSHTLVNNLINDFNGNINKVQNSYW